MAERSAPPAKEFEPERSCLACGSEYEPGQEYCLECGTRIVRPRGAVHTLGTMWRRRLGRYPGDWIWGSLLALAVGAAGATAAVVFTDDGKGSPRETIVATTSILRTLVQPPPTPQPRARQRPRPRTKPAAKLPAGALVPWPGTNGYTVVLASLPTSDGLAAAKAKAKQAALAGLPQVGIIVSALYASLHPGYYVIFSGVYGSLGDAESAASAAESKFPNAYARQIAR